MVEASTTKISSKGQVVIPANVRKAARLREGEKVWEGEKVLVVAIGDTVVLKKIIDRSFGEAMKPVWGKVRKWGFRSRT